MSKRGSRDEGDAKQINHFINGEWVPSATSTTYQDVEIPTTNGVCGRVALGNDQDVAIAVEAAKAAFPAWSALTNKARAAVMYRFHALLEKHADELADIVVLENGKNRAEALASVAKGNETVEWACSMPQLIQGNHLQVSRGITCHDVRDPIGVVASIVPFNFPAMVPMWTVPIALCAGNCVILKPSEKVPMTMARMCDLMAEAGIPKGVFQIVNGAVDVVTAIIDHPGIEAVTFVGSSRVAEIVSKRCHTHNKRCLALGGAKNHLVALPDCEIESASSDIVASFSGCCGQRCMAASVLLLVGEQEALVGRVLEKAGALQPGTAPGQVGAVIDAVSKARIIKYIDEAEAGGAKILLDGRKWASKTPGHWIGPTVIMHTNPEDAALKDEIFGPVISALVVDTWEEAIAIENASPFGNAASIYTTAGGHADWFTSRFRAGMLGVNIGVPVPREPFSFGGMYGTLSKFGDSDITGTGALEFFTRRRKITTRWPKPSVAAAASSSGSGAGAGAAAVDKASFVGKM